MNPSHPSEQELAEFLQRASAGDSGGVTASLDCHGGRAFRSLAGCDAKDAARLAEVSMRPPAGMRLLKYGSRSVVGEFEAGGGPVALKYYFPRAPYKQVTYALAGTRCHRSWLGALALGHAGIPTPPPLFTAEWKSLGGLWWSQSFLATGMARGITLNDWVERHSDDPEALEIMAGRLTEIFSRMEIYRIGHGDLKASNLIVSETGALSLVDLDAITILAAPGSAWKTVRERDRRIFHNNWKHGQARAASAFARVFDTA